MLSFFIQESGSVVSIYIDLVITVWLRPCVFVDALFIGWGGRFLPLSYITGKLRHDATDDIGQLLGEA